MIKKLFEISELSLGQPIRDKIENDPIGDYYIVQMKDVDKDDGISKTSLFRINLKGKAAPKHLKMGDILFVSRFFRESSPYGVLIDEEVSNLVAAPTFYIISVNREVVKPEYLHWYINSEFHGGKFFKTNAIGSGVLNAPKSVLGELPVILPSLEEQNRFVKLINSIKEEKKIMNQLTEKRKQFLREVVNQFNK